jgi:large subunit ribosomal protein L17
MRHRVAGKTFGRRPEQRKALLRGLAGNLIDSEKILTTLVKAKELRKVVEPLVTLAKAGDLHSRRQAASVLYRKESVQKLFGEIAERFKDRKGGYTRIYRTGRRVGDGAETAIIELLQPPKTSKPKKKETEAKAERSKEKPKAKPDHAAKAAGTKAKAAKKE